MDKPSTIRTAKRIAGFVKVNPASVEINDLQSLETTTARDELIECLRKGVAFHNADLVSDERLLIEDGFRKGNVRVICSTSTLAMGVNLPAQTVIIADAEKWDRDERTGEWGTTPLSVSEYRNMSGRAGRYRYGDKFGRSILLSKNQFSSNQYRALYIGGVVGKIRSTLGGQPIARQVLDIVVSKLAQSESEIINFMMGR
jgi:helicase